MLKLNLSSLDGSDGVRLFAGNANGDLGLAIDLAGDVNGDGFADFVITDDAGAIGGGFPLGESYVVFGKASGFDASIDVTGLDGADGFRITGLSTTTAAGDAVSLGGDINGDGFADVVMTAGFANAGGLTSSGETYVVFGKASPFQAVISADDLDGSDGFRLQGERQYDLSGRSASIAGDVNGDGFADLTIGAAGANDGAETTVGRTFVLFGGGLAFAQDISLGGLDGADGFAITGIDKDDGSGFSVKGAGDVNGDGLQDLIIGAFDADPGGDAQAGEAYVVFGAKAFASDIALDALDGANGFRLEGVDAQDRAGFSVSGAGDFNGDGFADLIIGAPSSDPSGLHLAGVSYLLFGKAGGFAAALDLATLDGADGVEILGEAAVDGSGFWVSTAGDFNADGLDDLIIGVPGASSNTGEAIILFGTEAPLDATLSLSSLDATVGIRLEGGAVDDIAGVRVAGGGDVNGDGFSDVIVSAYNADAGGEDESGEGYVVFGFDTGAVTHAGTAAAETVTGNGQDNVLRLGQGDDSFNAGGGDDIVRGGEGRDAGTLGSGDDVAFGGAGDDVLNGKLGDDVLHGGAGADRLVLGFGADTVYGGAGDDLIFEHADQLKAGDKIFGGEGIRDTLVVQSTGTLDLTLLEVFTGIERVRVAANQQITSTDDDLFFIGRSGVETYGLGDGDDIVKAGGGGDTILGGGGNDVLLGQGGDDVIAGGAGTDKMSGSIGSDTFVFAPGDGLDIVFDFVIGTDKIDLSAYGFTNFAADVQSLLSASGSKTLLEFAGEDLVLLNGVSAAALGEADFILV